MGFGADTVPGIEPWSGAGIGGWFSIIEGKERKIEGAENRMGETLKI